VSELEFNVPFQHKHGYIRDEDTQVSPSGMRAGLAGGLLVGVASVFTLVTGR